MDSAPPEESRPTPDYRTSLQAVGTVFMAVGVLEIVWTAYRVVRDHVLDVDVLCPVYIIIGLLLVAGSLRTARAVALCAALSLGGAAMSVLTAPLWVPWRLTWLYLKLQPYATARATLPAVVALVLTIWAYRRLTAPEVLAAIREPEPGWPRFRRRLVIASILGAIISLAIIPLANWSQTEVSAERAKSIARAQVGPGYRLYVRRISVRNSREGNADIIAYRDNDIRPVHVVWRR